MPIGSPFHSRTKELCTSYRWKDWAGYYCVCSYDSHHDPEYFAFRHGAGAIDVSPLYKYDVAGIDAGNFLARVMAKDVSKLKLNQVTYCCWCDDAGKVVDDGTVTKLSEDHYRVTAAEPSFSWFARFAHNYKVEIKDITDEIGALAIQGPNSRDIINQICDADMDSLKFFWSTQAKFDGFDGLITRTGYTGDLGYEIWVPRDKAERLWDVVFDSGKDYGLLPCGMDAMDVTRVEAGFIMNGVDYFSAHHCLIEGRKSTPYELGLGWTVKLDREPFIGQAALKNEKTNGSQWAFCGVEIDWDETEATYLKYGLPPQVCSQAWRNSIPIYTNAKKQIGYATSGSWSPLLKKNLALTTLKSEYAKIGTKLKIELTVEHHRELVTATVVPLPFFNPERKRTTPKKDGKYVIEKPKAIGKRFELEFRGIQTVGVKNETPKIPSTTSLIGDSNGQSI